MIIFKQPDEIYSYLIKKRNEEMTTGFVPTMGALHTGHIGLVNKARSETQLVICSIFVNPTQFNDADDFREYPTTIEKDIYQLEKAGCDILFLPSVAGIYPDGLKNAMKYELGFIETILEGKYRPGHFQGVCQVVHRLLDIVIPSKLYLGQKDFQQCLVIKKLVETLNITTEIVICETQREADGLAMSSRNLRLDSEERKKAPLIYKSLLAIKTGIKPGNMLPYKEKARHTLREDGFKVDYVEIADSANLQIVENCISTQHLVALAAVYLGEIRLIDNISLADNA